LELTAGDGVSIQGWYIPSQNGAVIIALHGLGANRIQVVPPVQVLLDQGYGLVLLDMRAHGNSGGATYTPCLAARDIRAVVDHLLAENSGVRIGLLGYSAGGHTALCAAAQIPEVDAVFVDGVAWGQTSDAFSPILPAIKPFLVTTPMNWMFFRFSNLFSGFYDERPVRELVAEIAPRPLYLVAAGNDPYEPGLAERYAADAGPGASFWVVDGVGHCGAHNAYPEEYESRLLDFFDAALLEAP
jgi:pimeloyl-ACP methyl ester carboxylesterase